MRPSRSLAFALLIMWPYLIEAAHPFWPSLGPVQTPSDEATSIIWEAHAWLGGARSGLDNCETPRAPFLVPRPSDGKHCEWYTQYNNALRRLWVLLKTGLIACSDLAFWDRAVLHDEERPLTCEVLQLPPPFGFGLF